MNAATVTKANGTVHDIRPPTARAARRASPAKPSRLRASIQPPWFGPKARGGEERERGAGEQPGEVAEAKRENGVTDHVLRLAEGRGGSGHHDAGGGERREDQHGDEDHLRDREGPRDEAERRRPRGQGHEREHRDGVPCQPGSRVEPREPHERAFWQDFDRTQA